MICDPDGAQSTPDRCARLLVYRFGALVAGSGAPWTWSAVLQPAKLTPAELDRIRTAIEKHAKRVRDLLNIRPLDR